MRECESLVVKLGERLMDRGLMCATAESCTGGWIAQVLTSVAGSSRWFDCGLVTYSNSAKCRVLDVGIELIERYGAVSEEVAQAMVVGAIRRSDAQVGLAVTGIAGPDGGSAEKPVGTVAFGWMVPGNSAPSSETRLFKGNRESVRWSTVLHAIEGLSDRLS